MPRKIVPMLAVVARQRRRASEGVEAEGRSAACRCRKQSAAETSRQESRVEQTIEFSSDGLTLQGVMHVPDAAAGPRPALILCHGFGGSCRGAGHPELARTLEQAGYVALRFDFRGCGKSEGTRGNVICSPKKSRIFMPRSNSSKTQQPNVDGTRIGIVGASLGGSLAVHVAAADRTANCVRPSGRSAMASGAIATNIATRRRGRRFSIASRKRSAPTRRSIASTSSRFRNVTAQACRRAPSWNSPPTRR